ncbi:BatA domain-containing protein [Gemmatimonas sp.]|uniref:BatA domain-containing protein n=1 Tax=Gemmatimonas sp. TaxID=1962908 RepID=UPI0035652407
MIGFATPWILGVALVAALTITALHFLSVRQPRVMLLPTARFVPERDARAVARQAKPSDLLLLSLRVIALLAVGGALAGARCGASGAVVASIIVIDATLRADSAALVARAVTATAVASVAATGDASVPTVLWVNGVTNDPGVAIAAAIRESARQAQTNPSLAELSLAVVMPASVRSREGWDAWRGQWPARIQMVPIANAAAADTSAPSSAPAMVRVVGTRAAVGTASGTDVVEAAFALRGAIAARGAVPDGAEVVVQRTGTRVADRAPVVVQWPPNGVPTGWQVAPVMDSVGAVTAAGIALVAPWVRTALPPPLSDSVRAIAWWSDGIAVAVERTRGTSCVREVALAVAAGSDLLLSPAADGLLRVLRAPCEVRGVAAPRANANATASNYASAGRFREAGAMSRATRPEWLATALLALALVALLAEQIVRRGSTHMAAGSTTS